MSVQSGSSVPSWLPVSSGAYQADASTSDSNIFDEERKKKHVDLSGATIFGHPQMA